MVWHDRVVDDPAVARLLCPGIGLREAEPERGVHGPGAEAGDAVLESKRHVHGEARGEARPREVRDAGTRSVRLPARTLSPPPPRRPPAPLPEGQAGLQLLRLRHLELAYFDHPANLVSSSRGGPV